MIVLIFNWKCVSIVRVNVLICVCMGRGEGVECVLGVGRCVVCELWMCMCGCWGGGGGNVWMNI